MVIKNWRKIIISLSNVKVRVNCKIKLVSTKLIARSQSLSNTIYLPLAGIIMRHGSLGFGSCTRLFME